MNGTAAKKEPETSHEVGTMTEGNWPLEKLLGVLGTQEVLQESGPISGLPLDQKVCQL